MGNVTLSGPELSNGVASTDVPDGGRLLGQLGGEAVLLIRRGGEVLAVGATCTHYSSSLGDGHLEGDTLRCPWHHGAFNIRSGEAVEGPAFNALPCWAVSEANGRITLGAKKPAPTWLPRERAGAPSSVVIIGAGAAGTAAAEEARRRGYSGPVTLVDVDADTPVDRPNVSKDSLAGTAPEDWLWLHPESFYETHGISRRRGAVKAIERVERRVVFDDGSTLPYGALLLATGATPVTPTLTGEGPRVYTLRTVANMRAIIAAADASLQRGTKRAVVLGTSFIGLEAAASLKARGLDVHVIGPDAVPLVRVLGPHLGRAVRALHEKHGIVFHFEQRATGLTAQGVVLANGQVVEGDFVVAGVGVRPNVALAEAAGLALDRGVLVDAKLRTNDPCIWAAGDVARYPDALASELIRVEHWAVAQNQGRVAARNMLGGSEPFRDVPFFWSQHYDVTIGYVGHAESWDDVQVDGSVEALDCAVTYRAKGHPLAVATINRDRVSLEAHAELTRRATAKT